MHTWESYVLCTAPTTPPSNAADCALECDWPLVWTALPLVSEEHTPPQGCGGALRVRSPPALSAVLQHCHNLGGGSGGGSGSRTGGGGGGR